LFTRLVLVLKSSLCLCFDWLKLVFGRWTVGWGECIWVTRSHASQVRHQKKRRVIFLFPSRSLICRSFLTRSLYRWEHWNFGPLPPESIVSFYKRHARQVEWEEVIKREKNSCGNKAGKTRQGITKKTDLPLLVTSSQPSPFISACSRCVMLIRE